LGAGTESEAVVIGGVLTIAIADSFSDALGVHMIEESREDSSALQVWKATIAAFLAKFLFALSFLVPVVLLPIGTAVIASVVWGFICLSVLSAYLAQRKGDPVVRVVAEHVIIAGLVVVLSTIVGDLVAQKLS
jgi:VIT1/CCC1 family predicted Fe2+/Mn2+ transporter